MATVTVGVAIPSIPPRGSLLGRALRSVHTQTRPVDDLQIAYDTHHRGASFTRNEALAKLRTEVVAFLDDDDEFLPHHIEACLAFLLEQDADMVYPWYEIVGGEDPFPETFGKPFDPEHPCQTTITCLWRRAAIEAVGGFVDVPAVTDLDQGGHRRGEDMRAVERLVALGGRIVHLPERTWVWHHHGGPLGNTSGLPGRWRDDGEDPVFGAFARAEFDRAKAASC